MSSNAQTDESGFFTVQAKAFGDTIRSHRARHDFVGILCFQAFDSFDGNIALLTGDMPALACESECATCCGLRVVATAPEVFLLSRFVTANVQILLERGIDIKARVSALAGEVAGLSETERWDLQRSCLFIEDGNCLSYRLRTLACRGHAAFDRAACEAAARGEAAEVSLSRVHAETRGMVQHALMFALRQAGLAFGLYELAAALQLALSNPMAELEWIGGQDPLRAAQAPEFDEEETVRHFETIGMRGASAS